MTWKKLAVHNWVSGCKITESEKQGTGDVCIRRFTATIRGWRNFRIYEGELKEGIAKQVKEKVREIRDRIDSGDEKVFYEL